MGSRTEDLQSAFMEFLKIPQMVFAAKVTDI